MADSDERSQATPERGPASAGLRLIEQLVPGLARRLGDSIDEIEVARDGWRVRVQRARSTPMAAPVAAAGSTGAAAMAAVNLGAATHDSSNGVGPAPGPGPHLPHPARLAPAHAQARSAAGPGRLVATSPAVGVFMPRGGVGVGSRVRAGDRLGMVDLLGVPQDVLAPGDGVLSASLVAAGEGVEYGQELLVVEASA